MIKLLKLVGIVLAIFIIIILILSSWFSLVVCSRTDQEMEDKQIK